MQSVDVNWGYIKERVRRYNERPTDDLLYRIGTHVDVLTIEDQELIQRCQQGYLNPEQRFRILSWLIAQKIEIQGDLALLIFGRKQLEEWLEQSRCAYPDFEFYLAFEADPTDAEPKLCFTMHGIARPGAPQPSSDCDFPWQPWWESGDMFWGSLPGQGKSISNRLDTRIRSI